MITEALKYLATLATDAAEPKKLPSEGPHTVRYLVGGEVQEFAVGSTSRTHSVDCLGDLIAVANRFAGEGGRPAVWHDEKAVVAVLDDDTHRDNTVTLTLKRSDLFDRVLLLRGQKSWMDQKTFVRLLRVELAGTMPPSALLDRVRKIKIENGQTVSSEVSRNKESLGRAITSAVSGEGEIPEVVTLELPVYKTMGETDRYPIACSVELDPTRTDAFRLMPLPDEIERVWDIAVTAIAERLASGLDKGIPSYLGRP